MKQISIGETINGDTFYRCDLEDGSRAQVFQNAHQAFYVVQDAYLNGKTHGVSVVPPVPLSVSIIRKKDRWQNVETAHLESH